MKFQPGNKMSNGKAGKLAKPISESLRHLLNQPVGKKHRLGYPRKPTTLQVFTIALMNKALDGDLDAMKEVINRVDGRPPVTDMGNPWDTPPDQESALSLKEVARVIGYLLISQAPDGAPASTQH